MPNDLTTAVEWLLSIAPQLERFKSEDAAQAELHQAHVDAWLDADVCSECAEFHPTLRHGRCPSCLAAYYEATRDEWEGEERERRRLGWR